MSVVVARCISIATSAFCSIPPDSRRSDSIGDRDARDSIARFSCAIANNGTSNMRAVSFRPAAIASTCTRRSLRGAHVGGFTNPR